MTNIEKRLDLMNAKVLSKDFREMKGLSNEVGYYIFDYPAQEELIVRNRIQEMIQHNQQNLDDFSLIEFDLYNLMIDFLKKENFMEQCYGFEEKSGFLLITTAIEEFLKIYKDDSLLIDYIYKNSPDNSVVFLTGVGKCYPILRSHIILNNLHQVMDHVPVVMFYPGKYDGQELILFSKIKDGNYYRAFPLID